MEDHEAFFEVRIGLSNGLENDEELSLSCQVAVHDGIGQLVRAYGIVIPKLLSDYQESELSWYLESYAQDDVFATSRAAVAEANTKKYAQELSAILTLDDGNNEWVQGASLSIVICAQAVGHSSLHALHWEVIESTAYWEQAIRPNAVVIVRRLDSGIAWETEVALPEDGLTNILLVSARSQLDRDIPHRLASAVLVSVTGDLPAEDRAKVETTLVRNGTFESFTKVLLDSEPGYFDIVHLDLHGIETSNGVEMAFLKHTPDGISPDYITGKRLAQVLVEREVRSVIMNACRSAGSRRVAESLVAELINGGVRTVIGMAFDAIASSVERFLVTLYSAHLQRGLPLHEACHAARLMLVQNPGKTTRYGNDVDVLDAFVPVCYVKGASRAQRQSLLDNERLASKSRDRPSAPLTISELVFGRENDILLLETNFLCSTNVAILQGPAGIGKTRLLAYACDWWMKTGVIEDVACIQLALVHLDTTEWLGLQTALRYVLEVPEDLSWDAIIGHLKARRYCLCIDSLESIAYLSARTRLSLRQEIKALIRALAGGQTIILITSRRDGSWVSPDAYIHSVRGINPAAMMQYVKVVADEIGLEIPYKDQEQLQYLEKIVKLVDHNPLVLYAVLQELHTDVTDFRTFFYSLVCGHRSLKNLAWANQKEGAHSIVELSNLITHLEALHAFNIATELGDPDTTSTAEIQSFRASLVEPLLRYNLPEDCLPPFQIAQFWNRLPSSGLAEYVLFCNLEVFSQDIAGFEHASTILAAYPGAKLASSGAGSFQKLREASSKHADMVLLPMQKLGFISLCQERLSESRTDLYYEVHPLLTLLSRSSAIYQENKNALAKAFVNYQAYRLKEWPWKYEYGNRIWQPYLQQASLEFTNNLCAAMFLLAIGYRSFWTHVIFKRIVLSIQKSLVNSLGNQFVVAHTWASICHAMMNLPHEYLYQDDSEYQIGELLAASGTEGEIRTPEELQDFGLYFQHMLYYERKYLLGQVGMSLIAWKAHENAEGLEADRKSILGVLKEAGDPPGIVRDSELASTVRNLSERVSTQIEILKRLGLDYQDWSSWWRKEGVEKMKSELAIFGVEELSPDRYNTMEHERPWDRIPIRMNPTSTIIMSFVWVKEAIEDLLEAKDYAKAREVIGNALHSEINFRGDHAITKVKLMELLARVDETDQKWSDAFQRWQEAEELEDSLLIRPSSMKRLKRSLKLAKPPNASAEGIVLREIEPHIEAEAMKGLYKLDLANAIDGPVSAIFLLIRGAKSQYRLNGSRLMAGEWIAFITETHAQHHDLWLLGPPNDQAQSILISNALRIFGQYILSVGPPGAPYIIFALYTWFVSNNEMEKVELLFHDIEERLFVGPGVEPGCRLMTLNLRFPEQNALFEFMHVQGMRYLDAVESVVDMEFPLAPYTATDAFGSTKPPDYTFPTDMMLRLAGYIVDW